MKNSSFAQCHEPREHMTRKTLIITFTLAVSIIMNVYQFTIVSQTARKIILCVRVFPSYVCIISVYIITKSVRPPHIIIQLYTNKYIYIKGQCPCVTQVPLCIINYYYHHHHRARRVHGAYI